MSNFEFVIPVSKEDLLKKTNVKDYAVEEVLPARRLPFQLKSAENEFKTKKHEIILTHFDSFYSIIEHFHMIESDVTSGGWKLILKVMSSLTTSLLDLLEADKLGADESGKQLNMVKMSCYILGLFVEKFESEAQAATTRNNASKSFKKKGASKSSSLVDLWESERESGVKAILQLVQLKVERLYDPPILEEEFIALVTGICYRILETCHQAKSKSTRDYIFHVLGIMVNKHGHCFSCVVKLLQLLQQNEQLVAPLAQGVAVISEKYGAKAIVGEIMREIGRIDTKELSRDSTCSKCFSSFLYELSRTVPDHVLPSIAEVMHLLEEESYTMRNSILGVFGELLIRLMNSEELDSAMKTTRGQFLNHLQEHLHDVNAFVRSRVLQIWQMLVEEQLELVSHFSVLLPLINGRIQDKSSNVRKYAVQTIIKLIKANDVTLKLNAEGLQKNLAKELAKLKQLELEKMRKRGILPEATEVEQEGDAPGETERMDTTEDMFETEVGNEKDDGEVDAEYERLKTLIDYLKSSIAFITESRRSISLISLRLGSKVASDVTEAIEFLMTGYEAGMKECIMGVRSMLPLIFSKEKEVKDAVVAAYKGIYLEPTHDARMSKAMHVVTSLIALANTARTLGDKEALRELIQEFVRCDLLSEEVTRILWQKFTFKIASTTAQESKATLELIGFIASEQVEMLEANMDILISDGLQNQDYLVVMETCLVLMKLASKNNSMDDIPNLLPNEHEIFQNLTEIISQGITKVERPNFVPMVERAVTAIYKLAERPDSICTDIILGQIEILSKCSREDANCTLVETDGNTPPPNFIDDILDLEDSQQPSQRQSKQQQLCPSEYLTRFLSTCSHVAVQQLIYLDVVVFAEMKRQQRKHEKLPKCDNRKSMASMQSASASGSARTKRDEQRTIEDELGLVGNVAEDADAEFIKKVIEREIVTGGKNLLSLMEPIIVTVCSNQVKFSDPALSAVSALALVKLMAVSSEYCEAHLRLLFTILEKSNNPIVRSNTIIGIGDLASRFPNQLEPWTANIYNRLRDRSMDVRLSTLQILTQLILNDMIKVKGQISEIALCILDDDPSISYTAKMFFTEFARKANAIYNILPDIVSRLSDPESSVAEEQFQPIMKFLVSFIEKEKQSESLCEKLCHRMRATVHERQWRDLSYCLSLLPANEKCIKKLNENFACFSDKLQDPYVLDCMQTVVSNAKKFVKQDAKPFIEEFSDRLVNHNRKKGNGDNDPGNSDDDDDVVRSFIASSGKRTKSQTASKKNRKERRKTVAKSLRFDDDDDDEEEDNEEVERTNKKKPTNSSKSSDKRPIRQTKKTAIVFSSSDDDLEFE